MGKRGWKQNDKLLKDGNGRREAFIQFIEESKCSMAEIAEWIGYTRQYIYWLKENPMGFETARRLEEELGLQEGTLEGNKKMKEVKTEKVEIEKKGQARLLKSEINPPSRQGSDETSDVGERG